MIAKLIQEQVSLESRVKFVLIGEIEISGRLVEIGRGHIKIEVEESHDPIVIPIDRVSHWQSLTDTSQFELHDNSSKTISESNVGKNDDSQDSSGPDSTAESQYDTDQGNGIVSELGTGNQANNQFPSPDVTQSQSDKNQIEGDCDESETEQLSEANKSENQREPALFNTEIEILKKLVEIETRFQAKFQSARIEVKEPDFKFPAQELGNLQANAIWTRIQNKYNNAKKINELSAKFGRIQPILSELKALMNQFGSSVSIKRHFAYLCMLSGDRRDAIKYYQEIAISSQNDTDWYNLAVVAQEAENEALACYSLDQVFHQLPATNELEAWYLYVHLLLKFNNHRELRLLCQTEQRAVSQDENSLLLETVVYLLKMADQEETAKEVLRKSMTDEVSVAYLQEILNAVNQQPTENYQRVAEDISSLMKTQESKEVIEGPPQGHIYSYKHNKGYGFLRDRAGTEYWFHISNIMDPVLLTQITHFTGVPIPVAFQVTQGSKGVTATQIFGHKTIHDWYDLAESAADTGDYAKAIAHIKEVLSIDKNYLNAQAVYDTWREYARASGVPKGSTSFARAKRAQLLEKDLDKALELFRQAIAQDDNLESAVNDLASLLTQLNRFEEAVKVIEQNRSRVSNRQSLDNVLTNIYKKFGVHNEAIKLLNKQLSLAKTSEKKNMIRWQIASSYLKLNDYVNAEKLFRAVLEQQPDNVSVKRNIAFCLSKREQYDEAEKLLNQILIVSSDQKTAELFEAVSQAKQTGAKDLFDGIVIEAELSDYSSGQVSSFTQFFLDRCDFKGVPAERIQTETFHFSDIAYLERQATESKTIRPSDRASYYLSASKIISILEDEDRNRFYRFLCRSFASKGDDAVINNGKLDAAREWYAEALSVYDGARVPRRQSDEQDAANALVRFLHSRLGRSHIPMPPHTPSINDTIDEVIEFADSKRLFEDITYLVFRSKYAANRLLSRLYDQQNLRNMALQYLETEDIHISDSDPSKQKFISLWNQLRNRQAEEVRKINRELRLLSKCQLTTAWLETAIEQTQNIVPRLRLPLDQDRIRQLQESLERAIEMCKQVRFEAQQHLWDQIDSSCRDLLTDVVNHPTRISVEVLYPVIENIQTKVGEYLQELYVTSKPDLTLSMPVEDYSGHDLNIEVEIAVENKLGCRPAENLELIIKEDHKSFELTQPEIRLEESLLGGNSHNFMLPLRLTDQARRSETFSLSVYARYRTQTEESEETPFENFTIRLYPEEAFTKINNPYNEGPVVSDPDMFYGRDRVIENIANSIQKPDAQNKCVVIYGQKRSGKSSVLYHLKEKLLETQNIVILDLGNIGEYLDPHSRVPFSYQILRLILRALEEAIEDRIDAGSDSLNIPFPNEREFYENPTPMILFKETFNRYLHLASTQADWQDVQLVLLIDEFSYIYGQILAGHISELFMKNWKALMQANYFNAVLVGQDVMERFLETYQNEFGIARKERVTYLDREDAVKLIDEPIHIDGPTTESRYREQRAIERIMELTAGSPFYIQLICNRLVEYINHKRAKYVTYSYVEHVKNQLMSGREALGLGNFENLYNSGEDNDGKDQDVLKILKAIAIKSQTGLCNRSHIDCKTELPIDELLDELVERDVVNREKEHYYSIKVGLFKEWLLANYKGEI